MSSGIRMERRAATTAINLMRGMLNLNLEKFEVGGSFRRGSATIGDVDMIVMPSSSEEFLDHLDSLVARDLVNRGKTAAGKESWGEKKRLVEFKGLNFDIAIGTTHNFGYLHWLRTGPGEANTLLMGLLAKANSRIRMDDGYLWHVTYNSSHISSRDRKAAKEDKGPAYHKLGRLGVPDEATFFKLLGMPFIKPEDRGEILYRRYLGKGVNAPSAEELKAYYLTEEQEKVLANQGIKQHTLF